jgi:signal transduction histidine kinase
VRDLPIFWKLLLPFLVLLMVVGAAGAYLIARDMTSRSESSLSEQLTFRAVEARSQLHDSELDLLESSNYTSNLQGMAEGVASRDPDAVGVLLESVVALKLDVDVAAVTATDGVSIVELVRVTNDAAPTKAVGTDWSNFAPVRQAREQAARSAGLVRVGDRVMMLMVAPICEGAPPCTPAGFAIVGVDARKVAGRVAASAEGAGRGAETVALYGLDGALLTSTGDAPPPPARRGDATDIEQRQLNLGGKRVATAYTEFTVAGQPGGVVAVAIPASTAFSSASGSALRLVALLVLAMAAAIAVGALVSRLILRQLRAVVETSRALGAGDLSARAPVMSADEHGELAVALNRMAEQLEAEHATLELQVEQRTEEIRRLLRDRTEFFAGLSHELRTPLAIIITQASMLLAHASDPAAADEAGETIQASASQLLELVNDILDLARAEAGAIEMIPQPVALDAFFAEVTPMLARLGAASNVEVLTQLPGRIPAVTADPARLREVVVNLVGNAVKYTPTGGSVDITAQQDGDHVRISVADTGVGIPPDVGDRVFEPFYLVAGTQPQRNQPSSGLGLALARRWVEAMGGTIHWTPNHGSGTVFTFTLPIDRAGRNGASRRPRRRPVGALTTTE